MPTKDKAGEALVDTSVALALLIEGHDHNESTLKALAGLRLGLAGHAAFEAYSVLTRLPAPARRPPAIVAGLISANFPATRYLSPGAAERLLARLAGAGVAGGAVYDALVAAVAVEHDLPLFTRDARAATTYRALQVTSHLID